MTRLQTAVSAAVNLDRADQPEWLDAAAAAARLGVSRATLYAYVSRGRLASHCAPGSATRRYRAADVAALAERHAGGPHAARRCAGDARLGPAGAAFTTAATTCWRWPRRRRLEDVAALLWADAPADALATVQARARRACGARSRASEPLHAQLARGWGLDGAGASLLRSALVLAADHERNASSFTVRCVASTGATLEACLVAGDAALSGPRHGGMTMRVEALWSQWAQAPRLAATVRRWIEDARRTSATRGRTPLAGVLGGFGHPLYLAGDPRARASCSSACRPTCGATG
jgi:citrate synthase